MASLRVANLLVASLVVASLVVVDTLVVASLVVAIPAAKVAKDGISASYIPEKKRAAAAEAPGARIVGNLLPSVEEHVCVLAPIHS